jgi:RimJ/RimL family protein N-acetyltransferase
MLGPTLETPRLILRPPTAADFPAYAEFMADADSARYLGGTQLRSVAWRGFASIVGAWSLNGFSMFSFIEKDSGRWVGRGGPWRPEGWPGTEVGWGIVPSAQRRGYAKEAAACAMDWAFDTLGWDVVVHCIDPANQGSIATAMSLGSRLRSSGVKAPAPFDAVWDIYGQTREAWRARPR